MARKKTYNGYSDYQEGKRSRYARYAIDAIQYMRSRLAKETQEQLFRTSQLYRQLHDESVPVEKREAFEAKLHKIAQANKLLERMNTRFKQQTDEIIRRIRNREYGIEELEAIAEDASTILTMENTPITPQEAVNYQKLWDRLSEANTRAGNTTHVNVTHRPQL